MASDEPTKAYTEAIGRAFQCARELNHSCGPVDFLVGISEGHGPAATALDPGQGHSLRAIAAANNDAGAGYLHMQAQHGARLLATSLEQAPDAEHLLIALLDQDAPGLLSTLSHAGLEPATIRRTVLTAIGAPADQPPIRLPELAPAGTMDRPPLPVAELDPTAWSELCWRQDHLPLDRLRRASDAAALSSLERGAAMRVAQRLDLDDDQRFSLLSQHSSKVQQLVADSRPRLVPHERAARSGRPRGVLRVTVGWAAWCDNRRVAVRDRWFRLRMFPHYR